MADKKQTLYEILQVPPSASIEEIKAGHRRLTRALVSQNAGLPRDEINFKLQVLDVALNTLCVPADRDAYDAQLAATDRSRNAGLPSSTSLVAQKIDATSLMAAAALESSYQRGARGDLSPLAVMSSTVNTSVSILGKILRIVIGLMVLGIILAVATSMLAGRRNASSPAARALSQAEEKVIIQEYYQQHGVRPGSKAEVDLLELENRRKMNDERAEELDKKKKEEEYRRFVDDSRREGKQVSSSLQRAEERARYEAEREERAKQVAEANQRRRQEWEDGAEGRRIKEARRKAGLN